MARFYGTVQGGRGEATRLGHKDLYVTAQSFAGDIAVEMWRDDDDVENVRIAVRDHKRGDAGFCLYEGKVKDLLNMDARHAQLQALGIEEFVRKFEGRSE